MNTKMEVLVASNQSILRCFSAEPMELESHFFWFAGDAPSIATKTAKSWRITKAMVVCDLAGQMSDMQHIHPFDGQGW